MSTSRLKERLAAAGIYNSHNFSTIGSHLIDDGWQRPYLDYRPQSTGRGYVSAAWQVVRAGFRTDVNPKAHWQDRGHKTFNCFSPRHDKQPQLEAARAWASEQYGVAEWAKDPWGAWHPAEVVEAVTASLRAEATP